MSPIDSSSADLAPIVVHIDPRVAQAFRALPGKHRAPYEALFTTLFVEGIEIEGFFDAVMEEINTAARQGALSPECLMQLLKEAYEDLLDGKAAAEALREEGENVLWEDVKKELGI